MIYKAIYLPYEIDINTIKNKEFIQGVSKKSVKKVQGPIKIQFYVLGCLFGCTADIPKKLNIKDVQHPFLQSTKLSIPTSTFF